MLPAVCACALAITCRSRRNSATSLPTAPSPFELFEFCSTSHTTSPASKTTMPINTASITFFNPQLTCDTRMLNYSTRSLKNLKIAKKGRNLRGLFCCSIYLFLNSPIQLQRKLKLPSVISRRRLPRRASRSRSGIAQLIYRCHIQPIRQIERIRNRIQLESLSQRKPSRQPQIELEKPWRHIRIPSQITNAPQRRRNSGHCERRPAVRQTSRRRFERHSRYKR